MTARATSSESTCPAPRVHVLLLNWNGWQDTVECLESVFRLDYPNYQVVLCDNASTDGSVDRVKDWASGRLESPLRNDKLAHVHHGSVRKPIEWVELTRAEAEQGAGAGAPQVRQSSSAPLVLIHTGANLGFAGGNNVGLRYLTAARREGYVWVLNNDIVVAPDSLRRMVEVAQSDATIGCVGGQLLEYHDPEIVQSPGGGRFFPWQGMPRRTREIGQRRGTPDAIPPRLDFINGGCMLVPTSTLSTVGLIDERYFLYCEDVDFSLRIRACGLRLAHCPEAEVWHKGGSAIGHRSVRHDYYLVRSALLIVRKFYPALLPVAFVLTVYQCVLPKLARREWDRLGAVGRAYRDFFVRT